MKLLCKLGWHKWGELSHRPCERFQLCDRCGELKTFPSWHVFEKQGDAYYYEITFTYGGDPVVTFIESKQKFICKDCKLMDVRTLV